jgi:hypothetical protein
MIVLWKTTPAKSRCCWPYTLNIGLTLTISIVWVSHLGENYDASTLLFSGSLLAFLFYIDLRKKIKTNTAT